MQKLKEKLNVFIKQNKGITLVALIITIIVMVILAGIVIVSAVADGGIIDRAQEAMKQNERAEVQDLIVASYIYGKVASSEKVYNELNLELTADSIYENLTANGFTLIKEDGSLANSSSDIYTNGDTSIDLNVQGKHGNYTGTVTDKGLQGSLEIDAEEKNISNTEEEKIDEKLNMYILGKNKTGRKLSEIMDEEFNNFLDDTETEENETDSLSVELLNEVYDNNNKTYFYIKYNNKAYKITSTESFSYEGGNEIIEYTSEKLELIYTPKGNEGQKTSEGWIILYDNETTIEALSPTVMGELKLGYSESATTNQEKITELTEVYNNAIDTINTYCQNLEGLPDNIGVRSVGAKEDTITTYFKEEDIPDYVVGTDSWFSEYDNLLKIGDTNYEQDMVRMSYWGVLFDQKEYWFASRHIDFNWEDMIYFEVLCVDYENCFVGDFLWAVYSTNPDIGGDTLGVRPIITIQK